MSIKMHMPPLTSVRGQTLLTDTKPYLSRQSPIASQMLDLTLTGGTVAWNQLFSTVDYTGMNATLSQDGNGFKAVATSASTIGMFLLAPSRFTINGHKYFISATVTSDTNGIVMVGVEASTQSVTLSANTPQKIVQVQMATADKKAIICYKYPPNAIGNTLTVHDFIITDLTQMFGSTIADYVYTLEQGTAGSGIAWLKSFGFFAEDYYPYDAGSLLSVKTSAHKTVGKNLVDISQFAEVYPSNCTYEGNTLSVSSTTGAIFSTGIPVYAPAGQMVVNATITEGTATNVRIRIAYDDGTNGDATQSALPYVTSASKRVIAIRFNWSSGGSFDITNFQLEYGTTATPYEPYTEHTYPLSDIELRGIPKLDASNNLYYDGDTYESDGTVTRKYGVVDLGTLSWTHQSIYGRFYSDIISDLVAVSTDDAVGDVVCSKYTPRPVNGLDYGTGVGTSVSKRIFVYDSSYTDAITFKTAMSGVYLVYELETPTTETTDAFENPQLAGSTEEYVDSRTVPMPVGHTTEYFNMEQIEKISMHMGQTQAIRMHMPEGD